MFGTISAHIKSTLAKLFSSRRGIEALQMNVNWLKDTELEHTLAFQNQFLKSDTTATVVNDVTFEIVRLVFSPPITTSSRTSSPTDLTFDFTPADLDSLTTTHNTFNFAPVTTIVMAHDIKTFELEAFNAKYESLAKELEALKIEYDRSSALNKDHDRNAAELEITNLTFKRSSDNARFDSQFWKNAHDNLQDKHIVTKDALKALTTEHESLKKEHATTKKKLRAIANTVRITGKAVTAANEHLEFARTAHNLTQHNLDLERIAHSSTKNQLEYSWQNHGVTYEQLQAAHVDMANMHNIIHEKQTSVTTALNTTQKMQNELDDERIDHEITRQTMKLLSSNLDTTRNALATLQADLTIASQKNDPSTSPDRATDITPAEALTARLRARLRDTDTELTTMTKAHDDLKKIVAELQTFRNALACSKDRDCLTCPSHMRQAFRVARANEAEANATVDKIQYELFQAISELQDCKQALSKVVMSVDLETAQNLASPTSSAVSDEGGSEDESEDSDEGSIEIYTGPASLVFMKIKKEEKEVEVQADVEEIEVTDEDKKDEAQTDMKEIGSHDENKNDGIQVDVKEIEVTDEDKKDEVRTDMKEIGNPDVNKKDGIQVDVEEIKVIDENKKDEVQIDVNEIEVSDQDKQSEVQAAAKETEVADEDKKSEVPEGAQSKAQDGHRFVQRTLLRHLGISARPAKRAPDQ